MAEETKDTARDAATHLNDTAKWIVGGALASAAAVFTGSSLSQFGALDPSQTDGRFWLACAGLAIGFLGIALLIRSALHVMTSEAVTYRDIAEAGSDAAIRRNGRKLHTEWEQLRGEIDRTFSKWPYNLRNFAAVFAVYDHFVGDDVEVAFSVQDGHPVSFDTSQFRPAPDAPPAALPSAPTAIEARLDALEGFFAALRLDEFGRIAPPATATTPPPLTPASAAPRRVDAAGNRVVVADPTLIRDSLVNAFRQAQFFKTKQRFVTLRDRFYLCVALMAFGFGVFAWAANPGDPPPPPSEKGLVLKITG